MISKIICWILGHEASPVILGRAIKTSVHCKRCGDPVMLDIEEVDTVTEIIKYRIKK